MGDVDLPLGEQWHSQPRRLRIICVGAGAAGLLLAYKMQKQMRDFDLTIYEKNPEVGGTWYENRYPGCACDVPAHVYTYSFEPNPDWSQFYASGPEIQQYFVRFAEKYHLLPYIRFGTKVQRAEWIEERGCYQIELETNGKRFEDWCHVLINATGNLNKWKWPEIKGLHSFQGTLLHSADWDTSVSYKDKTVAVIGTGSSAIQIVPQIQPKAKRLLTFMRSATWISPPIAADMVVQANANEKAVADAGATDQPITLNHSYTDSEKERFKKHPEEFLAYRKGLEAQFTSQFDLYLTGSKASQEAQRIMQEQMIQRIGPGHEELKKRLIPSWAPGCRRLSPGAGYLEALVRSNVTIVYDEISKIVTNGLVDQNGKLHEVDLIVCATGFDVSFKPSFKVFGVDGADMHQEFDPEPVVYLAMAVPKFPNYFTINGVRGNWATGTALNAQEVCIDYILQCLRRIQTEDIRALEVRREPVLELYERTDRWHQRSVWNQDCKSWYKNNIPGGKLWIWGGSSLHYLKTLEIVRWEHYMFRYNQVNIWGFLGNGKVKAEVERDLAGLTPYIRNRDEPWSIE
ncbi:hypothetical protein PV08_10499 [Exophiala spinifera]|uniref:FAD/NAD(P)-binding domain-containing protein n=1 Tax=Exophiala spinifera TaxID=91928 RepID=A0A0D2BIK5_9EURO|nr:uncharacterized protein PV08_10499 [Exophiala spinifera]KIW11199.1 hypothetical protein PV08_10499 [Exophiala spinifera]